MKGKKAISRVGRNVRNNLVKFADNLHFSYFKAPQKPQRFDEKRVKSATDWTFTIHNTPSCWTSRLMKNNWSYYSPNVSQTLSFFKKVSGFFLWTWIVCIYHETNLTWMIKWCASDLVSSARCEAALHLRFHPWFTVAAGVFLHYDIQWRLLKTDWLLRWGQYMDWGWQWGGGHSKNKHPFWGMLYLFWV